MDAMSLHYAIAIACPKCWAEPGKPCRSAKGWISYDPHVARVEKAQAERVWEKR